jgi:ferredoxin
MTCVKKVVINPGCITCGACEFIAPDVFHVTDKAYVKNATDSIMHEQSIQEAIEACPTQVIVMKIEQLPEVLDTL